MFRITTKHILAQLKKDLIGKDSHRGVTLTYSWLANQFGHFSLGFIPAIVLFVILKYWFEVKQPALWAAIIVSAFWFLFELYNFLGPLLFNRISRSKLMYIPSGKEYVFQPAWLNIAFDTATDVTYFAIGAFAASVFLNYSFSTLLVLIILALIVIYPSYYWFLTKMYLQEAEYPYQFRLSQWDNKICKNDKPIVLEYKDLKDTGHHLLIFGSKYSEKTPLAVGIATEMSIHRHSCFYTTAMKLFSMFYKEEKEVLQPRERLWTWRIASTLIIDDINPGEPIKIDIITPELFLRFINVTMTKVTGGQAIIDPAEENKKALREKNVIWVLGNDAEKILQKQWQAFLINEIGISPSNIRSIHLPGER